MLSWSWLLRQWSWKSFGIGAGAALFGGTIARPLLVGAVRTGMDLTDTASATLQKAKIEAEKIRSEAAGARAASQNVGDLVTELQKLREEIASLRTNMSGAKA
jgi:hypothetical protein